MKYEFLRVKLLDTCDEFRKALKKYVVSFVILQPNLSTKIALTLLDPETGPISQATLLVLD